MFYEVPHRVEEALQDIFEVMGNREIVVGRELTKIHEEILRGRVSEILFHKDPGGWRGEMTLAIAGAGRDQEAQKERNRDRDSEIRSEIQRLRTQGMRVKEIAEILGEKYSTSKREIYQLALPPIQDI